jgi:hypothetical protein
VEAIAVAWGVFELDALIAEKPDRVVHTIPELMGILEV